MPAGSCLRRVSYCGDTHWCFIPAGNYWRIVSYGSETQWCFLSTGNYSHKVSCWSDTQWYFMTTGTCSRKVSYCGAAHWCFLSAGNCSTGDFSTPLRCARNDRGQVLPLVLLTGRKLLAKGFLLWCYTLVFHADRRRFDRKFQGSASDPRNDNERDKALCHLERGGVSKWE